VWLILRRVIGAESKEAARENKGKAESPQAGGIMGLERAVAPPHERPVEPAAGISGEELKWTPDGRFVVGGAIDGRIHVWDVNPPKPFPPSHPPFGPTCTLLPISSLQGHQGGPSRCVAFNPRSSMFASAGHELAFWLPDFQSLVAEPQITKSS
jgi:COMPASS component SWD2